MAYVQVIDNTYFYVMREADPDDRWDNDDTATDHNVTGVRAVSSKEYYDLVVDFEPNNEPAYLLYGIYSSGDSFSNSDGHIEFVGLYRDKNVAWENYRKLKEHNEIYRLLNERWGVTPTERKAAERKHKDFDERSIELVTDNDGTTINILVPWNGYFENLTQLEVLEVTF